jgi:phosphohistidine phosphatase
MLIYLVRHAIAFERDSSRWPDDSDRPLTPKGKRTFRVAACGAREVGRAPEVVLSSQYKRAWQTAEILEMCARWPAPEVAAGLAADSSARAMLAAIEERSSGTPPASVALVGHEPIMGELLSLLLTGEEIGMAVPLKKGAIACVEMEPDLAPGSARLKWLLAPKALRAAARC